MTWYELLCKSACFVLVIYLGDLFTGMTSPAAATSGVTPEALSQAFGGMGQFGGKSLGWQTIRTER